MKIYDVSLSVSENLVVWEGDPKPHFQRTIIRGESGRIQVTVMQLGVHTGTHIDAPVHFIEGGKGVDQMQVYTLVGSCLVLEVDDANGLIHRDHLLSCEILEGIERVLLKTRNSRDNLFGQPLFSKDYVSLASDGADYLLYKGVRTVGIDYLSIAAFNDVYPVHEKLLGSGVVVIEGLDLRGILPGIYTLVALPMKLEDADGAPARVILIDGVID